MTGPAASPELVRWQRVLIGAIGVVLVAHTVLLALWLAPPGPVRDSVGDTRLASYVDPYFRQGDQTVGIGSNRVDERLWVRGLVRPAGGGKSRFTDWDDVMTADGGSAAGILTSARAEQMSRRLAANLNLALLEMSPTQRSVVAKATSDVSAAALGRSVRTAGGRSRTVQNFVAQDRMATRFASLWVGATDADAELLAVQYRVGRRVVPPIDDAGPGALAGIAYDVIGVGPRPAFRGDPEARQAFASYLERDVRG